MLRRVVGWIRLEDESWHTTMRRMNVRLETAGRIYPLKLWSDILHLSKFRVAAHIGSCDIMCQFLARIAVEMGCTRTLADKFLNQNQCVGKAGLQYEGMSTDSLSKFALEHFN